MAFRYFIVVCLIVTACAQVKSLEGGPKDINAPAPLGIVPANGTVNFSGNGIAIVFDEYIKLNNPNQTISVVPADIKIRAELKDKTLLLFWDETMRENTTYSIFLNKTIRDITESNDSIMQLVFSTGPFIDSLSYSTFVVDAKDGLPKKNVVVGLFEHPDSLKPIFFTQTDHEGKASLKYLKEGSYYLRAFEDGSKQGKIGKNDAIAFKDEPVQPSKDYVDSIPMRLFSHLPKPDVTTFSYTAPGMFVVGANRSLEDAELQMDGVAIPQNRIKYLDKDSLVIIARPGEENPVVLAVSTPDWTDTVKTRIPQVRTKTQRISNPSSDYFSGQPIVLSIPDIIDGIDTSKFTLVNLNDTTTIDAYTVTINQANELHINVPNFSGDRLKLTIKSGGILGDPDWKVQDFEHIYTKRNSKEFGVLNVQINGYASPILLEVIFKNTVVKKERLSETKSIRLEQLEPGDYTFRIIVDTNGNGQWDTGNFDQKIQPEEIHLFSTPTKVRANWEIDMELVPLNQQAAE